MTDDERYKLHNIIVNLIQIAWSNGADKEELFDALGILAPANSQPTECTAADFNQLIEKLEVREPCDGTYAGSMRFNDRDSDLLDLLERFEACPSWKHVYNARSAIERLRDEGMNFWEEGAPQLIRWRHYCNVLWSFIQTSLGKRRHENPDVTEALREFYQEYEHSSQRIRQMLHGIPDFPDKSQNISQVLGWLNLVYTFCTYAITAFWIDDKKEEIVLKVSLNATTGTSRQETIVEKEMKIPRKYRHTAKKL